MAKGQCDRDLVMQELRAMKMVANTAFNAQFLKNFQSPVS
jgi:hypothetical protein